MGKEGAALPWNERRMRWLDFSKFCCCAGADYTFTEAQQSNRAEWAKTGEHEGQTVQLEKYLFSRGAETEVESSEGKKSESKIFNAFPVLAQISSFTSSVGSHQTLSVCTESTGSEVNERNSRNSGSLESLKGFNPKGVNCFRPLRPSHSSTRLSHSSNSSEHLIRLENAPPPRLVADENGDLSDCLIDTMDPCYREFETKYMVCGTGVGDSQNANDGGEVTGNYAGQVLEGTETFHGQGRFVTPSWTLHGEWQNGAMHGQGHQHWEDGRKYVGQFKHGRLNGAGFMQWRHKKGVMVYEGQYCDDKKHGSGKFTWPSGKSYEGQWVSGERHGIGVDTSAKGTRIRAKWEEGSLVTHLDENDQPVQDFKAVKSVKSRCDIVYM